MNRLSVVKTGTKEILGLADAFKEWKDMNKISKREAARRTSKIDGQGFIKCSCKGKCNTYSCSCKKNTVGFVIHTVTMEIILTLIIN